MGTDTLGTQPPPPCARAPPGQGGSHHVSQVDHGLGEVAGENHGLAELQELRRGDQGTGWAVGGGHPDPASPSSTHQLVVIHHGQLNVLGLAVNRVLGSADLPVGAHS